MALLNSLTSAISGVKAQQASIDVIGHNIANATTVGFKSGRVDFATLISQTLRHGQGPAGNAGGINPAQVGLGVQVAGIQSHWGDGARMATGIATDLALEGSGFFVLRNVQGGLAYSRAGAFSLNAMGDLVEPSSGLRVQGYMANFDPQLEIALPGGGRDFVLAPTGSSTTEINLPIGQLRIARQTASVGFGGNLNSGGAVADMGTVLQSEPLFERVGGILIPAGNTTPLASIVRTNNGQPTGTPIELGLEVNAKITLSAQVGSRNVARTFTVGQPAPDGGNTLGELRDWMTGALGIFKSAAPGQEALSSIRLHAQDGTQLVQTLSQSGEKGYASLTLNGLGAGQTLNIGGQSFVAGVDFAVGATDAETASNLATALNLNNTLAPQLIASVVAPAGGPVQVRLALRQEGASPLTIDTAAAPGLVQTTGSIRFGNGLSAPADGDTITLTDGVSLFTFELNGQGGVTPGNIAVTLGATPAQTAQNLANAIAATTLGPSLSVTVQGGGLRITDMRVGGAALNAGSFLVAFASFSPGAISFEEDVAGVGAFAGAGAGQDSFMLGSLPLPNGTLPASIRDDEIDFVAAGVQAGDMIRFTTGSLAGTIARVTAVGQLADGTLDRNAITFEWQPDKDRAPAASENLQFFIHEAAGVDIGVASLVNPNVPPDGLDPSSPAGTLRISGNVGFDHRVQSLSMTIKGSHGTTKLAEFTELTSASGESFSTTVVVYDSLGMPHNVNFTFFLEARSNADPRFRYIATSQDQVLSPGSALNTVVGSGTLSFDTDGRLMDVDTGTTLTLQLSDQGARTPVDFMLDFAGMTSYAAEGTQNVSDVFMTAQDGYAAGTLVDFSVREDGVIQGLFSNGQVRSLAQLALARFANPNGLNSLGGNLFEQGVNSGEPMIGEPGQAGRALVRSGFLEQSNVELADQFTQLITSQRAFQANARTITTASQLLEELVRLV